jgi:hypothetical protein
VELNRTIHVVNHTAALIKVGVEPVAMYYEVTGGASLTLGTTFVDEYAELEIVCFDGGVALYLFGPTDVDGADSLPSMGDSSRPVPVATLSVANTTKAAMWLRTGDAGDFELAPGSDQEFTVAASDDDLRLTTGKDGVRLDGWRLSEA